MKREELQDWSWFALNFQWIGLGIAVIILIYLFGTDKLRHNKTVSKWKDYTWLSWLGTVIYLLHNVEEYGIDILGRMNEFPVSICQLIHGSIPTGVCPSSWLYLAVNIPAFWIMGPVAALMSKRYPLVGFSVYSIIVINTLMHLVPLVIVGNYSSGTLTAGLLFVPISIWLVYACFGKQRLNIKGFYAIIGGGILCHIILVGAMFAFIGGIIPGTLSVAIEAINPFILIGFLYLMEKRINNSSQKKA